MKIKELLNHTSVLSVSPEMSGFHALEIMANNNIGALPVIENGKVIGLFTERAYARNGILKGHPSKETPVRKIMKILPEDSPHFITEEDDLSDCIEIMNKNKIRYLLTIKDRKLSGIVSVGDTLKAVIHEQKSMIGHLSSYIEGVPVY